MPILAGRGGKDLGGGYVVPLALEACSSHLTEEQVAQDDEGPRAHVGPRLEALPRRPCLQQRLLDKVIGKVTAAGQRAPKRAQMRDDRRQLIFEFRIGQRNRLCRNGCWSILLSIFRQI